MLILASAAVMVLGGASPAAAVPGVGCRFGNDDGGSCGHQERTSPGPNRSSTGTDHGDSGSGSGSGGDTRNTNAEPVDRFANPETNPLCEAVNSPSTGRTEYYCSYAQRTGPGDDPAENVVVLPVVTTSDFQSFEIPSSTLHAYPADWSVAHRETAFWADSSTHTLDLTLAGFPVQVRATPVEYRWDFGDGTTETTTSAGFEPDTIDQATLTHVYSEAGEVTVDLTTVYSGMYRIGTGPWLLIAGHAQVASTGVDMEIYRFHRYLVRENCLENPTGPDC
ncbi:PKD domain-containing protein [Brevibacterium litoralis]|uniref:PKD domain-containing protein n=1 Tax=Brevibacterium litoralis TaxID=3138935 RepID=UPI0032EE5B1F